MIESFAEHFIAKLDRKNLDIPVKNIMQKGSANIVPEDWVKIAEAVVGAFKAGADGVVILHGTDTMHYTAAALSFFLSGLGKPVVMTGSIVPGVDRKSDALFNLNNAIDVAAFSNIAEVCIVFSADEKKNSGVIIRGCRAKKIHSTSLNAFDSINIQPIGFISNGSIQYTDLEITKRAERDLKLDSAYVPNVVLLKQNPALTAQALSKFIANASGAVIEGTGAGHLRKELIDTIASARLPVVISTQVLYGGVKWGLYASDKSYEQKDNIIPAWDMTSETALVKLMWALGKGGDIRSLMLKNVAGEITESKLGC
jgi:L-asparaginase type I